MRSFLLWTVLFSLTGMLNAQVRTSLEPKDIPVLPQNLTSKILSGKLIEAYALRLKKSNSPEGISETESQISVALYFSNYPSAEELNNLENQGVKIYTSTYTPPMENHPYGYMLARVPYTKLLETISLPFVAKVSSSSAMSYPDNNQAARKIKADSLWARGFTGKGVKIAILDSGLDTEPLNSDLPESIVKRDYCNYPASIDDNVENITSGHGTHVTGSVLGRGVLSASNTGNGGGAYKGMAPEGSLIFLKIGGDASSGASDESIVAAIHAAVDTFNTDVISMSYGGWDTYHDGSSLNEQAVDWAYSKGVPCFMSAGNNGVKGWHNSGTVGAMDSSDFIQVNVSSENASYNRLYYNLIWSDGAERSELKLQYYNSSKQPITNISTFDQTESLRGTESSYSYTSTSIPFGAGTYYLKVINKSSSARTFHIYDDLWNSAITFNDPDLLYTVGQPSSADHAFSVGAYVSRQKWTDYSGSMWTTTNYTENDIAHFSSRGPRIDGTVKPQLTAPGSRIISMRDRDVYNSNSSYCVDDDGTSNNGTSNYYVMQGTSMATPVCAGAAMLLLQKNPNLTPQEVYDLLQNYADTDTITGTVPNGTWGSGKLNIFNSFCFSVPVELLSFSALSTEENIILKWSTATETNNQGFEIQRSCNNKDYTSIGFVKGFGSSSEKHSYIFTDNNITNRKNYYRLKQVDLDGSLNYSEVITAETALPSSFVLRQNYPNPFNPSTVISYKLPVRSRVTIQVFDILGCEVSRLLNDTEQEAGVQNISFPSTGNATLANGVYFYRINCTPLSGTNMKSFTDTKKMMLIK